MCTWGYIVEVEISSHDIKCYLFTGLQSSFPKCVQPNIDTVQLFHVYGLISFHIAEKRRIFTEFIVSQMEIVLSWRKETPNADVQIYSCVFASLYVALWFPLPIGQKITLYSNTLLDGHP